MIPQEKLKGLLERLIKRSQADDVRWIGEGARISHGQRQVWYQVRFPTTMIRIGFVSPTADPDYYVFRVDGADGTTGLARVAASADDEGSSEWFELLKTAFNEAERHVTGWDRALAELEAAVGSNGPIGLEPATTPPDDEVPF